MFKTLSNHNDSMTEEKKKVNYIPMDLFLKMLEENLKEDKELLKKLNYL
jgi:CRISPR/Cas system CSM-associated protein Csm4 (group 5 of RAMP superfamily)